VRVARLSNVVRKPRQLGHGDLLLPGQVARFIKRAAMGPPACAFLAGEPGFEPGFAVLETARFGRWLTPPAGSRQDKEAVWRERDSGCMLVADGYCYSYLLGMYLGDGCITSPKATHHQLRVSLDAAYPEIVEECVVAVVLTTVGRPVYGRSRPGMRVRIVECSWKRWPELFPQHGPGRKHKRRISLERWQRDILDAEPEQFLRGLIHSDGCRTTNRFKVALL
jgi:hypothetical protein